MRLKSLSARVALVAALASFLIAGTAAAEPREYELDPNHTSIGFLVGHAGFADVLGMFREAEGSFTFDEETGEISDLRVVVQADSVFTNQRDRDGHLRSGDFLNAREYPEIVFTGERFERTGDRSGKLHGTLTLRGQERPITLDVTLNRVGEHPFGGAYTVGASARTSFDRTEFGITYASDGGVGNTVDMIIEIEAIRQ